MSLVKHAHPPAYLPPFCLHFVLPNVLLGVLALVVGAIGGEYGISYLVWHDEPVKQFWVGFGLSLVSLQALYVGFLLWGKKAGRPDQLVRFPQVADRVNACLFGKYALGRWPTVCAGRSGRARPGRADHRSSSLPSARAPGKRNTTFPRHGRTTVPGCHWAV